MSYKLHRGRTEPLDSHNVNYMKRRPIDIPENLAESFPHQGIRLAVSHSTGRYAGNFPMSVAIYLVPRNGASSRDRTLVETVTLMPNDEPIGVNESARKDEVVRAINPKLSEILGDYLTRTKLDYICGYCSEKITEGEVSILSMSGEQVLLHVDRSELGSLSGDCSDQYIMDNGIEIDGTEIREKTIPFEELEKVVDGAL